MVRFSHLIIFIATTSASLLRRAQCNRDNCLRAVVASDAAPGPAQASADCSSFLLATATLCPVTSTTTVSTTPTTSVTASTSVTTISTLTSTVSATSTSTITTTVTSTVTTSTITGTSSVASLDPTGSSNKRGVNVLAQNKRDLIGVFPPLPPLISNAVIDRRAAVTTCPSVGSPSVVPTYASACSGTSRYSSACLCDGVTKSTTTLSPVTSSVTVTVTGLPVTTTVATVTSTSTVITTTLTTITSATVTSTQTMTVTTTTTTGAVATATVGFTQKYQDTATSNCFYDYVSSPYLNEILVSTEPTNNYQAGRQECAQGCADYGAACKAFYLSYSLNQSIGQTYGYCLFLDHQYTSSDIACGKYQVQTYYIVEDNRDT